jgi:chromosome segregation ATPase
MSVQEAKKLFEQRARTGSQVSDQKKSTGTHFREKSMNVDGENMNLKSQDSTDLQVENISLNKKIKDLEAIISEHEAKKCELIQENENLERDLEELSYRCEEFTNHIALLECKLEKTNKTDSVNDDEVMVLNNRIQNLEKLLNDSKAESEGLKVKLACSNTTVTDDHTVNNKFDRLLKENEVIKSDKERIAVEYSILKEQVVTLTDEKKNLKMNIAQLENDINALKSGNNEVKGTTEGNGEIAAGLYADGYQIFKKIKVFYTNLNDLEKSKLTRADITLEKFEIMITEQCIETSNTIVGQMKTDIVNFIHNTIYSLKEEIEKLSQIIDTKMKMINESAVSYSQDEISASLSIEKNKVKDRLDEIAQWESTLAGIQQI